MDQQRKYNPNKASAAAYFVPQAAQAAVGVGTLAAISKPFTDKVPYHPSDKPALEHLVKTAKDAGADIRSTDHPMMPAAAWNIKSKGLLGKLAKSNIENISKGEGAAGNKGIMMNPNVRTHMKAGVFAHELGHLTGPRYLQNSLYHIAGPYGALAGSVAASSYTDQKKGRNSAILGTAAAAPLLASEANASWRGSKLLNQAYKGKAGLKRLTPFAGIASYGALAAMPAASYAIKKSLGGYKPVEKKQLSSVLDDVIEFKIDIEEAKKKLKGLFHKKKKGHESHGGGLSSMEQLVEFQDLDAGISRNAAPTAIQKLVDKVNRIKKKRGETDTNHVPGDCPGSMSELNSKLDSVIEFREYPMEVIKSSWRKWKKPNLSKAVKTSKSKGDYPNRIEDKLRKSGWNISKMSSALDQIIEFGGDPRPRNHLGEFSGGDEGGPDPNAMYKTYAVAPQTPGMSPGKSTGKQIGQGAALALTGGFLGAAGGHGYKGLASWVKKTARSRK